MKTRALSLLAALLLTSASRATPPEPNPIVVGAEELVQQSLLRPLAAKEAERSKFSRARLPPQERRLRIIDTIAIADASGARFLSFAVDARHGFSTVPAAWSKDAIVGCVYLQEGEVFVKKGDEFRPASVLLGKKSSPSETFVCTAAPTATTPG